MRGTPVKHLNIVLTLEEQFGISFDEQVALEMENVPQIRAALTNCGVGPEWTAPSSGTAAGSDLGLGSYVPSRIMTNAEVEASTGLAPGTIEQKTGSPAPCRRR